MLEQDVERDVGTGRARHLVEALIAGRGDDDVIARLDHDVRQAEDRLLGSREDEHVVRLDAS